MEEVNSTEEVGPMSTRLVVYSTYGERQLIASFFGIVALVGALGNCLVLLAVVLSRKLRTVPNVFVVNLSVADLISCLNMPWQAVAVLSPDGWPLPDWMCVTGAMCLLVPIGCSVNTLTLIAVNRFVIITRSTAVYQRIYRARWIAAMVSAAWVYPLAVIGLPLVTGFARLGFDETFSTCAWDAGHPNSATFALAVSIASYPLQFCTIIACYSALFARLYKHNRAVFNNPDQSEGRAEPTVSTVVEAASAPRPPGQQRRSHRKRQTEVTKNLFYVICAFFVCLTPYAICIMRTDTYKILPYSTVFLFVNSCLNPFIYAKKHSDFRKVFSCILRCRFRSISGI